MKKQFVVCIVGARRHAGKTTVLTGILKEMKKRGFQVGTIKHIGDRSNFELSDDKDTRRHIEAGSSITLAVTSSEIIIIRRDLPATLEVALSQMPKELGYVLVEGFRESKYPKIVVLSSQSEVTPKVKGDVIAVVADQELIIRGGIKGQSERFDYSLLVDQIEGYFRHLHLE